MSQEDGFTDISDVSFYLPDIIVESVLREGFAVMKRNPELVDHVFKSLKNSPSPLIREKYGKREMARIKKVLEKYDWSFVHSFNEVEANLPCVSIQLLDESEAQEVGLEDFDDDATIPLEGEELLALVVQQGFTPTGYNQLTGTIALPDSVDLSNVHVNLNFVDSAGAIFEIVGGIVQVTGQKQVMVQAGSSVNISGPCVIKSGIDYKQITIRHSMNDVNILLGVHTKDALMTKYFYILIKYFLLARKETLIERGFTCSKYRGSEFTRNLKFEGDSVFNRFLTLSGKVQDSFRTDQTQAFDNVQIILEVPKDQATTEDLGFQDQTVQVGSDSQDDV